MKDLVAISSQFVIGEVDSRMFGGFIEHLGRAVYSGIFEPEHPTADQDGFRSDVLALVRSLQMPLTRYPGGNFVSGYNWKDGIGKLSDRPVRMDFAWASLETNRFGVDDFVRWCRKAGTAPLMAVNLGSGSAQSAAELVEYCNFPGGTQWSDLRRKNGGEEPYRIKTWCLGNEMDGFWQIGAKSAREYGALAREAAKMMKWVDPEIELVVCGSSGHHLASFGSWDETVLEETFEQVDYLSLHCYLGNQKGNYETFFASSDGMARQIEEISAVCDCVAAKKKSDKKIYLSFDEWNVWYHTRVNPPPTKKWQTAPPLLEESYTAADALVVGDMLIALLNHADRVKIACLAQTVNVIAPIMTVPGGKVWRQTIYFPFYYTSRYGRGMVLQQSNARNTDSNAPLRYAVVRKEAEKELVVFAVNRSLHDALPLAIRCLDFVVTEVLERVELLNDDLEAVNSPEEERVAPRVLTSHEVVFSEHGEFSCVLSPASWNMIRLRFA
ncbi:MAG: alpha-N-arabinofuranosidase [Victivallaceae bacterium]|nr:alpha-N-arabinofuranosidase [Victivallaceae bacterium]